MSRKTQFAFAFVFLGLLLVFVFAPSGLAQQPGINTNVLPSLPYGVFINQNGAYDGMLPPSLTTTDPLRGDGYLQRQDEPAIAASTYNPDHILAAFNDYRTVSIPNDTGLPGTAANAWIGLSRSYDRGRTWAGSLVPGFPQDTFGTSSPLYGLKAGSDPGIATTPGGHFYIGGLFFTPGGLSNIAVVHYRDVPDTDGGDTIRYIGAVIVDKGSASDEGNFTDKDGIAADIARGTTNPSVCGPVYIAYTIFTGGSSSTPFTSKLGFSRSKQGKCGTGFDSPQYLNKSYKQNQGAAISVDPSTGKIYVVWRHVSVPGGDGFPDGVLMATSTDFGGSFSAPVMITPPNFAPYDQPNIDTNTDKNNVAFRSNSFPAITVDGNSNVYVATQEKIAFTGPSYQSGYYEPRIVIRTLQNGASTWTAGSPIDYGCSPFPCSPPPMQQVMPSLSFSAGLLKAMWYDFRDQAQASYNFAPGAFFVTGLDRQMKTYVAESNLQSNDANGNPVFGKPVAVSMYLTDPLGNIMAVPGTPPSTTPGTPPPYPAVNRPNLPMYNGGTTGFTGDYITIAPVVNFVPSAPGSAQPFRWATQPGDFVASSSYGAWTDSRDVVFPDSSTRKPYLYDYTGWQTYAPPGTGQPSCVNAGSRDANVYMSEIKPGVVASSPALSRQLVDGSGNPMERAFPITVENFDSSTKFFRISFNPNTSVAGTFTQGTELTAAVSSVDAEILAFNSVTSTIYVFCQSCTSSNAFAPFSVSVNQINSLSGNLTNGGLQTQVLFNSDPTAPFVTNANLSTNELHNVSISNPTWGTPTWGTPTWGTPTWGTQNAGNPTWGTPTWGTPTWGTPTWGTAAPVDDLVWTIQDAGNNASAYSALLNVAMSAVPPGYGFAVLLARNYMTPGFNGTNGTCNVQPIPYEQVISVLANPTWGTPTWGTPTWGTPTWGTPTWGTSTWTNATFAAAPPLAGSSGAATATSSTTTSSSTSSGPIQMPRQPDTVYLVLRVYPTAGGPSLTPTQQMQVQASTSVMVAPQAPNTTTGRPTIQPPPQQVSNKAFSTTTLSASTSSLVYGQTVSFTATVNPQAPATGTPTGTVDFVEGTTVLATKALSNVGQAVYRNSSFAPGTHTLTAVYSGDANFNFSVSGSASVTITQGQGNACNAGDTTVAYNAIPFGAVNCLPASEAFEAQSASEFGDEVGLGGTARQLSSLSVVFASYGCGDSGHWNTADCMTTLNATFTHPITANIYSVSNTCTAPNPTPCVGTLLATVTTNQTIPYRPSADSSCTGTDAGKWHNTLANGGAGACQNSISTVLTFTFPAGTTLPDRVIWTVAFNTSDYGATPLRPQPCNSTLLGCPYDSLNVGTNSYSGAPYAGTDLDPNGAFLSSTWTGAYCDGGNGGTGFLRLDTPCWTGFRPLGEITTTTPPPQ